MDEQCGGHGVQYDSQREPPPDDDCDSLSITDASQWLDGRTHGVGKVTRQGACKAAYVRVTERLTELVRWAYDWYSTPTALRISMVLIPSLFRCASSTGRPPPPYPVRQT